MKYFSKWLMALLCAFGVSSAWAADYVWTGATDQIYGKADNWTAEGETDNSYPQSSGDVATIGANKGLITWSSDQEYYGATGTLTIGSGSTVKAVSGGDLTVQTYNLAGGATFAIETDKDVRFGSNFTVAYGTFTKASHGVFDANPSYLLWHNGKTMTFTGTLDATDMVAGETFVLATIKNMATDQDTAGTINISNITVPEGCTCTLVEQDGYKEVTITCVSVDNALDFSGVEALAGRVSADLAALVVFEELEGSTAANGEARISAADGKIKIQATDVRMASYGLGHYIREIAGGHISWCGNQYPSTWKLPESEAVIKPLHPYAIAYNYCTLAYTMAYWGLDAWQAEIDRLALQGYNVALVTAGLQKVWKDTLLDMDYDKDQIKQFIADDAVSAWWHMGNLQGKGNFGKDGIAYEVSDAQIEYDGTFGEKLVTMMREVGIEPIIQSFIGLIPSTTSDTQLENFVLTSKKVKEFGFTADELTTLGLTADAAIGSGNARLFRNGNYADGQKNPDLLDPTSKAFAVFSKAWNKNLAKVYGFTENNPPKFLGGDLFHESSPPSGMTDDEGRNCAVNIQNFQKEAFGDDVIWVVQSWQGSPDQRVRNGLDPANTLIQYLDQGMQSTGTIDYSCWNNTEGKQLPWIWCEVMNFGGNTGMHGAFRRFKNIGNISTSEYFKGYGMLSEGLETNPSSYEMYASTFAKADAASQNVTDEAAWIQSYRMRRYGLSEDNDILKAAHELCAKTTWDCKAWQQGTLESIFCAVPAWSIDKVSSWGPPGPIAYDREELVTAASLFLQALKADSTLWNLETFKYDFVEIFQQILTDKAREMLPDCQSSKMMRNRLRTMINLLDNILACSDEWRLDKKEARLTKYATDENDSSVATREKAAAVKAYRRMVTSWVPGSWGVWTELGEYAHRSYAGLIKHYYGARWEAFLDVADGEMTQSAYDTYIDGLAETFQTMDLTASDKTTPVMKMADAIAVATKILDTITDKTYVLNVSSDCDWNAENAWTNISNGEAFTWENGEEAVLTGTGTITANAIETSALTIKHPYTYSGSAIPSDSTCLGWFGLTPQDLQSATFTAVMSGGHINGTKGVDDCVVLKCSDAVKNGVAIQVQTTDDGWTKAVKLKLWVENGVVFAQKVCTYYVQDTSKVNELITDNYSNQQYEVIGLNITNKGQASNIVIDGTIATGNLILKETSTLTANQLTTIENLETDDSKVTFVLGDTQKLVINALTVSSGGTVIFKGTAETILGTDTETFGISFVDKSGNPYQPNASLVYVCTTDSEATEQPLKVDYSTGTVKRVLSEQSMDGTVPTTATDTGWTNITLDELATMEFTGTITTTGDARGYNVTRNTDNVTVEMLAGSNKITLTFTLNGTAVYVAADVAGLSSLTAKLAVARANGSNYASFSDAHTIAKDYTNDKQVSIINDVVLSTARQVKEGVTVTIEPGVVLTSGVTDVPDYDGTCTVVVKGTLDLANTRWTISTNNQLELYAGAKVVGSGESQGAIEIYNTAHTIPVYARAGATEATISAPIGLSADATFDVAEGVTLIAHNFNGGRETDRDATLTKSGNGAMILKGTLTSKITLVMEGGTLQHALAPNEVFKVKKNATSSNTVITSGHQDYKVKSEVDSTDSTITVYTSVAKVYVANVTEKKADASEGDAGTKFEDIEDAKKFLLTKLPADPDAKLWLMGTLKAEPPTHDGWMTDTRFVAAGIRMWPIAATVNGTAYETFEEAIEAANGAEIEVGTVLDLTPPEGWVISDGKLVAFSELVYTDGATWEGATWTPAGLSVTTAWVDGKDATFNKSATLSADGAVVKNLTVQSTAGTTKTLSYSGDYISTEGTTLTDWTVASVEELLCADYTGTFAGAWMGGNTVTVEKCYVDIVDKATVSVQAQIYHTHDSHTKVVVIHLKRNEDGTVTATHQWAANKSGDHTGYAWVQNSIPEGQNAATGTDTNSAMNNAQTLKYALSALELYPRNLSSVTVTGSLTVQDKVTLDNGCTFSAPALTTIPQVATSYGTLVLGDTQTLTIQDLDIPEGGTLIIKGTAATIPAESLYFKDAEGYALNLPVETVYYVSTGDGNDTTPQELMVDESTGAAKAVPPEMGTNWITTEATATGWTGVTLTELSHMVFIGQMDVVSDGTTTTTDAQGYSITLANDTLLVTMKDENGTSVALTFTADADGAIQVKANEASETQGVHSLAVAPAEAILYTDANGTTYSNYADFETAFVIATAETSSARYLSVLTDMTLGSAYKTSLKNGVVFTIEEGVTVTSAQTDVPDWGSTCTIVVKGTLDLAATRWSFAANNSLELYTGAQILGTGEIYDGVNVGSLDFDAEKTIKVHVATDSTEDIAIINPPIRVRKSITFEVDSGATVQLGNLTQDTADGAEIKDNTITKTGEGTLVLTGTIHDRVTPVYSAGLLKRTIAVGDSFKVKNAADTDVLVTSADAAYMVTSTTDTTTSITTYTLAKIAAKVVKDGVTTNYQTLAEAQVALATNGGTLYLVDTTIETPEGWIREEDTNELWKPVAKIGDTLYRTVEAAVAAWQPNDTLILVDTSITTYPNGWHLEEGNVLRRWVYWKKTDSNVLEDARTMYTDVTATEETSYKQGYGVVFTETLRLWVKQAITSPVYIKVAKDVTLEAGHENGGTYSLPSGTVIILEDSTSKINFLFWGNATETAKVADLEVNGLGSFGYDKNQAATLVTGNLTGTATLVIEDGETITATSVANPVTLAGTGKLVVSAEVAQITSADADKKVVCTESNGTYTYELVAKYVAKIGNDSYESITAALAVGTSVEVVGRSEENVTLSEDATLTVNGGSVAGTITVPENVTLTLSGTWNLSETVFSGAGTVKVTALPTVADATFKTATDWTGTVVLEGEHANVTDFDPGVYGKSGSTVQIDATFTGNTYFKQAGTCDAAVVLNGTMRHANGWSNGDGGYRFTGTLTGTGTLVTATNPNGANVTDVIAFTGDASAFAGTITVAGGHCVAFGEKSDAAHADTDQTSGLENTIQVVAGKTISIASGKTWTAPAGFVIAGTLADGSNLTLSESSTSTVTGTLAGNHTFTIPTGAIVKLDGAVLKEGKTITANGAGTLELVNENSTESSGAAYCSFDGTALVKVTGDFIYGLGGGDNNITNPVEVATGGKLQIRVWNTHNDHLNLSERGVLSMSALTVNGTLQNEGWPSSDGARITAKVSIASGKTLAGSGTISIPVTLAGGAILDATAGQLTIDDTLTWPTDTAVTVKVNAEPTEDTVLSVLKGTDLPFPTKFTVEYNGTTVEDCAFTTTETGLGVTKIPADAGFAVAGTAYATFEDALTASVATWTEETGATPVTITKTMSVETLDLSTVSSPDMTEGATLAFDTGVTLTVTKELILGTNRGFFGWDADGNPDTTEKAQLIVADSAKVTLNEGPVEGSPLIVNWTMSDTVPVTLYTLNYVDETTTAAEIYTTANGKLERVTETVGEATTVKELSFLTSITGKGTWYEWTFDKSDIVSTGRNTTTLTDKMTDGQESNYYVTVTGDRKAILLTAGCYADVDYTQSLEAPNWSASFFAKMPENEGGTLISFGSSESKIEGKGCLALVRGKVQNQVLLVYMYPNAGSTTATAFRVLADMKVPHAESEYHLYSFVKYSNHIEIYLDQTKWTTVEGDFGVATGLQFGELYGGHGDHDGATPGPRFYGMVKNADGVEEQMYLAKATSTNNAAIDMLRIYDCYLSINEITRISADYLYVSPYGTFEREITTATANWNETDAWKKTLDKNVSYVAYPEDGDVVLTATVDTTVTVNMPAVTADVSEVKLEGLALMGTGAMTFKASTEAQHITVEGNTVVDTMANVDLNAISLEGPVNVATGKTLTLTLSDELLTKWGTDYVTLGHEIKKTLTGYIAGEGTITFVAPDDNNGTWTKAGSEADGQVTFSKDHYTVTCTLNATSNSWEATYAREAWAVTIDTDGTTSWTSGGNAYTSATEHTFLGGGEIAITANGDATLLLNGLTTAMTVTGTGTVTLTTPTTATVNELTLMNLTLDDGAKVVFAGAIKVGETTLDTGAIVTVTAGTTLAGVTDETTLTIPANASLAGTGTVSVPVTFADGAVLDATDATATVCLKLTSETAPTYGGTLKVLLPASFAIATNGESVTLLDATGSAAPTTTTLWLAGVARDNFPATWAEGDLTVTAPDVEEDATVKPVVTPTVTPVVPDSTPETEKPTLTVSADAAEAIVTEFVKALDKAIDEDKTVTLPTGVTKSDVKVETVIVKGASQDAATLTTHSADAASLFDGVLDVQVTEVKDGDTVTGATATATIAYDFGVEKFMMKRLEVDGAAAQLYIVLKAKVKNAADNATYAKDTVVDVTWCDTEIDATKLRELTKADDILGAGLETDKDDIKKSAKYFLIDPSVLDQAQNGPTTHSFKVKARKTR